MAATAKKPDGGSSDHARRPRTARTSSSLSASSAGSASDSLTLNLSAEAVAALPPPGLSGPTSLVFSPKRKTFHSNSVDDQYLAFVSSLPPSANRRSSRSSSERQLCVTNVRDRVVQPLLNKLSPNNEDGNAALNDSLEERLRRERQRLQTNGGTQFDWCFTPNEILRILVPMRGNIYIQDGIDGDLYCVYDKQNLEKKQWNGGSIVGRDTGAIDPQLSPDGTMVAFVVAGDIYVVNIDNSEKRRPVRLTFGARHDDIAITHGLADFVAQEEMDRYRGFWWQPDSCGILFAKVDETRVPPYRITHQGRDGSAEELYEDHRYPFAGQENPRVQLGHVRVLGQNVSDSQIDRLAEEEWENAVWFSPPREASEYLARVTYLPDGTACAQWQNRTQTTLVIVRMETATGKSRTILTERSDVWINLHHMFHVLPRPIHPDECSDCDRKDVPDLPFPLPDGSFSFLFASERSGYCHLYLYTYIPGVRSFLLRSLTCGPWVVESIAGVDMDNHVVYVSGTYDSPLERHLYAIPLINRQNLNDFDNLEQDIVMDDMDKSNHSGTNGSGVRRGLKSVMTALSGATKPRLRRSGSSSMSVASDCDDICAPVRLTTESGMHSIVMNEDCTMFVDSSSDLGRPTSVCLYDLPEGGPFTTHADPSDAAVRLVFSLYDAAQDSIAISSLLGAFDLVASGSDQVLNLPPPEILSFPTSDGTETLHAALYKPDPVKYGPGPYPLICAVYGGPHVQRVNRSWSQCADMRAQRLRSMGFAVVKCDNRGSSRRGLAFESAIKRRLGRLEVLDQVTTVRQLTMRGVADPSRVGIYGWSYGGYLSAMCLCRAPDIFHVAIAGAPVTSWDGYDTHYTERYMGLPAENASGYRESAVFDHIPNMRGKLMIVHGLIDENVHFRHTARLINRLIASGKDYDLLIFPDERHSPRRLRDRIYMEQRISDYFTRHLGPTEPQPGGVTRLISSSENATSSMDASNIRSMAGRL
jgi:dipeptidyl-peptidase-4